MLRRSIHRSRHPLLPPKLQLECLSPRRAKVHHRRKCERCPSLPPVSLGAYPSTPSSLTHVVIQSPAAARALPLPFPSFQPASFSQHTITLSFRH
jgi:hypothetical protein